MCINVHPFLLQRKEESHEKTINIIEKYQKSFRVRRFLGIYTSYDKLHERVLRDVKSINIREEEDESKDIFNRNIYRSIITDDEIRKYVVIEANEDEDYEKLVESYCYLE